MPSLTSQNASSKVRRIRRCGRRVNTRGFASASSISTAPPAVKRRAGQRLNRDQASFDLENYFNICQDQGFHCDPDVRIGSELSEVNYFGVLDPEASAPSSPRLPSADQVCDIPVMDTSREGLLHPMPSTSRTVDVQSWIDPDRHCAKQQPSKSCVPSIPSSPAVSARVKLPCSLPSFPKEEPQEETQPSSYNYFDGIRIPSPLLYHRRSREQLLTQSSDAGVRDEIEKSFYLTYGREQPSPDFESYKIVDPEPKSEELETGSAIDKVEAKPTVDQTLKQRGGLAFYNIPRPPWLAQSCQLIGQRFSTPPELLRRHASAGPTYSSTPPILTATNGFSIRQLGIPCNNVLGHTYNAGQGSNPAQQGLLKRNAWTEFVDDDPDEVNRRWQAFEDIVCNITRKPCSSEETVIARPSRTLQQRRWFDFTENPARECKALVPARLYRQQYIGWSPTLVDTYPTVQPRSAEDGEMEKVCKVAGWISELGLGERHAEECALAGKSSESSVFGLDLLFEADAGTYEAPVASCPSTVRSPSATATLASAESESFDEGYCTGESMVNIDRAEASASSDDDEWEQWD